MAAIEHHIDVNESAFRTRLRETLYPYSKPGVTRTLSTLGAFEMTMVVCYVLNMIVLALPSGYDDPNGTKTQTLKAFETVFTVLYIIEISLNGISFGFLDLLHPVRLLDSLLVLANLALLILFYQAALTWNVSLLPVRCSLRILRPLFVTTEFPNVRVFVVSIARSVLQLTDVTLLFLFFLLWFGVAGVFQFGGILQTRCVNDFYSFGQLDRATAIRFFGVPSQASWTVSRANSSLNDVRLDTQWSSVIPVKTIFGENAIISNPAVSEKMLIEAMYTFAQSYVEYYGLQKADLVCGSLYTYNGSLAMGIEQALFMRNGSAETLRYTHRQRRGMLATVSQTRSLSPSLLAPFTINYEHDGVINPQQLMMVLNQVFQLNPIYSCSTQQTCGKNPAQALTGFICPYSYTCLPDVFNPYNGSVNFDNLGFSMLTLFTANSFQLWYETMWWQRGASDALAFPFMILELVIGTFMIIGLMVVVLTVEYDKSKCQERDRIAIELERRKEEEERERMHGSKPNKKKLRLHLDSFNLFNKSEKPVDKTKAQLEQEKEDEEQSRRDRGKSFLSIVRAAKEKGKESNAEQHSEEEDQTREVNVGIAESPTETQQEESKSMFSLGVVALLKGKIRKKIQARQAAKAQREGGTQLDQEMTPSTGDQAVESGVAVNVVAAPAEAKESKKTKEDSSDSEEELRAEEQKQREEHLTNQSFSKTKTSKNGGLLDDTDEDDSDDDDGKRRRRAARAILRRKIAKETKPWKVRFRQARFFTKWYIVQASWFIVMYSVVVVGSTIAACSEHYGMDPDTRRVLDDLNIFFTVFFLVELGVRMLADTARRFFKRYFNVFDLCNVVIAVLDVAIGSKFPLLRALRIFRVFKLIDVNHELQKWLLLIAGALSASPMLLFMLLLVMFIFSTFGMQLFGGAFCGMDIAGFTDPGDTSFTNTTPMLINVTINDTNGTSWNTTQWVNVSVPVFIPSQYTNDCANLPRSNFDNFGNAMLTSFVIATGDNWNYVMYNAMNAVSVATAIPFIIYYYIAVYIMMNLLISIFLSAAELDSGDSEEQLLEEQRKKNAAISNNGTATSNEAGEDMFSAKQYTEAELEGLLGQNEEDDSDADSKDDQEEEDADGYEDPEDVIVSKSGKVKQKSTAGKLVEELSRMWIRSRKSMRKMVEHQVWQTLMIINILVGTIGMGFEDPIAAPDAPISVQTRQIDLAVNIVFIIELALYVHIYGFMRKPTAYMRRDGWNVVDFVLIVISFVCMIVIRTTSADSTSRVMFFVCFLRSLRPLRVIRRARGMRKVMSAVLGALPEMKNVFIVTFGLFATWSVFGIFFFQGQLRNCWLDGNLLPEIDIDACATIPGAEYINTDMNFDNFFFAMLSVYVCSTLEDWSTIMWRAMDIVVLGQPKRKNASSFAALYFVIAAFMGGVVVMNLFVSVLISSYNERKRKAAFQRSILLTKEQEAWTTTNKRLARLLPMRNQEMMAKEHQVTVSPEGLIFYKTQVQTLTPESVVERQKGEELTAKVSHQVGRVRIKIRDITRSSTFSNLFLAIVLANFVITAIVHYPESAGLTSTIQTLQSVFTICFVVEAALKIAGDTFAVYMNSQWNRLDFLVAVVSLLSLILSSFYDAKPFSLVQMIRITRLARLTKEYFALDRMIAKFASAILSLGNVMCVIVMVYFIYAVLGMKMFGRVQYQPFGAGWNGGASNGFDSNANFFSLSNSLLLLARMTTMGDWPVLLTTASRAFQPASQFCDLNIGNCGLLAPSAEIFFVTFIFIATVILLNLFTAVLLDAFGSSGLTRALRKKEAEAFFAEWKSYDPDDTFTINPYDVLPLIRSLPKECVLGFNGRPKRKRIGLEFQFLASLQLVDLTHRLTWVALVDALCKAAYAIPMKPKQSIAYLVFTDLLHQPMQQFAQIGRNVLEITDAAQTIGLSALSNVQRLSRLVSGKKIRARRESKMRQKGKSKKGKNSVEDEYDPTQIHQDVMMFLSTIPPDACFNPFLLPAPFLKALRAIAKHTNDKRLSNLVQASEGKSSTQQLDEPLLSNNSLTGTVPMNNSLPTIAPREEDPNSSMFSPREGGEQPAPLEDNSMLFDGTVVPNDSLLHHTDLFPPSHPVMHMFQPTDVRDLFAKCSALIMINAVVKRRRSRLAQRVLETKIEREILAKLQRELGIVVPESVIRSASLRGGGFGPVTSNSPGSPKNMNLGSAPSKSLVGSGMSQGATFAPDSAAHGAQVAVVLDERFTVGAAQRKKSMISGSVASPTVALDSTSATSNSRSGADEASANSREASATHSKSLRNITSPVSALGQYDINYRPTSTAPLLPHATQLIPDVESLHSLDFNLSVNVAMSVAQSSSPSRDGDGPGDLGDGSNSTESLLVPYDAADAFMQQIVLPDPMSRATVLEEVHLLFAALRELLSCAQQWQSAYSAVDKIQKPFVAQGIAPPVFSEELTDHLEDVIYRSIAVSSTLSNTFRTFRSSTSAPGEMSSKTHRFLANVVVTVTLPAMGRVATFQQDVLARQVDAGKERLNEKVSVLIAAYRALSKRAQQLEDAVVDKWPTAARLQLDADSQECVKELQTACESMRESGIESVFAGASLPKTIHSMNGKSMVRTSTKPVNPECAAYQALYTMRTIELIDFVVLEFSNISAVRMISNPRTTIGAATQKAIQYYFSVTDLAEVTARSQSNAARVSSTPLGFREAIDKLVTNALFRTPSSSNLDSMLAVLREVLMQEAVKPPVAEGLKSPSNVNGGGTDVGSPTTPASPSRARSSTVANKSVLALIDAQHAKEALLNEKVEAEKLVSAEDACYRLFKERLAANATYKPDEKIDPYFTSLKNFCSTLSKSEKMKQESKINSVSPTMERSKSIFGNEASTGTDAKREPELLSLDEYRTVLVESLTKSLGHLLGALRFVVFTPNKCLESAIGVSKSLCHWKVIEVSDFAAIAVRDLIVSAARDRLNEQVNEIQSQRRALGDAETEVHTLNRISCNQRSQLSFAWAYTDAKLLKEAKVAELREELKEHPEKPVLIEVNKNPDTNPVSEPTPKTFALVKRVVCPLTTSATPRSRRQSEDLLHVLAAWAHCKPRSASDEQDLVTEMFSVLGNVVHETSAAAKMALKATSASGAGYAPPAASMVQVLYRNQPGLEVAMEDFSRITGRLCSALKDVGRAFSRALAMGAEVIVEHETEKVRRPRLFEMRMLRENAENSVQLSVDDPLVSVMEGSTSKKQDDSVLLFEPEGQVLSPQGLIEDDIATHNRSVTSVMPPKDASSTSHVAEKKGTGRSHEQLIADAKARAEARREGRRDIANSPARFLSSSRSGMLARTDEVSPTRATPSFQHSLSTVQASIISSVIASPSASSSGMLDMAKRITSLCRNRKPSVDAVHALIDTLVREGISIRFFATSRGEGTRLPRSEFLYYPALLRLMGVDDVARDCFSTASLCVSKKASKEVRASLRIVDARNIRYPLDVHTHQDIFPPGSLTPAHIQELNALLPRMIALTTDNQELVLLVSSTENAILLYQVIDAIRDAATI